MANAVEARWHGDDYQARFFWIHAASLLDPQRTDVVEVTYEADGPKAFDDVVIRYDPARPSNGPYRVSVDYHQIKWHTDRSGRFGYAALTDPAFIGAQSVSLLERLVQAKANAPSHAAFTLVTTDRITDGDPLGSLLSTKDGALIIERLFVGKTASSRIGKVRKAWREHLGLADDEALRDVLAGFHIVEGHLSLDDMRGRASERLRLVGLIGGDDRMEFTYDAAAQQLKVKGINKLDRHSFEALVTQENWRFQTPPPPRTNVALRAFSTLVSASERLETPVENCLAIDDLFDGRHLRPDIRWSDVRQSVSAFLEAMLAKDNQLRMFFDAHASIAFLAGATLGMKSGADVELRQRQRSGPTQIWYGGDGKDGEPPVIAIHKLGDGRDVAVSVGLTRPGVVDDVQAYVAAAVPDVGTLLEVIPAGGPGQTAIAGGAHAVRIADAVASAVAAVRPAGSLVHIFASAPNAVCFFLGQHAEAMGRCLPYEFDFGAKVDGTYRPTFEI